VKPAVGLAAYAVALVVAFGAGAGIGALVGPVEVEPAGHQQDSSVDEGHR